jgi:hypothetical protein
MEHYLYQGHVYRNNVPEPDVTLEQIRHVLFSYFGVEESKTDLDQQIREFAQPADGEPIGITVGLQLTKEETDAWIKAGMPSPPGKWLKDYRDERR